MIEVAVGFKRPVVALGVRAACTDDVGLAFVGESRDAGGLVGFASANRAAVCVTESAFLRPNEVAVLAGLARMSVRTVVLTDASRDAATLLRSGASGVVLDTAAVEEIIGAIHRVARGELVADADAFRPPASSGNEPSPRLTEREREVLRRVAHGATNVEIAAAMHLSRSTVKTHLAHACGELGVSGRSAAVAAAMRLGLLDVERPEASTVHVAA